MLGTLQLNNHIYNASGVHCTSHQDLSDLDESSSGAVLSKSCTWEPLIGNPQPRYYYDDELSINSTGLANIGIQEYSTREFSKPYIVSIAGRTVEEFRKCVQYVGETKHHISAIEVNLSCPNIQGLHHDAELTEEFLALADTYITLPWGLKLPPLFHRHEIIHYTDIIGRHNMSYVVCSNSLPNGLVFRDKLPAIKPRDGLGGIGGSSTMKAIALSNAYQLCRELPNISVVGCGGIRTREDVLDYMSVGCSAVQVGTQLDRAGLSLFTELLK